MKKLTCALLALLLAMSALFVGCAEKTDSPASETSTPSVEETSGAETTTETTTEDLSPITVTSTYLPAEVSASLKTLFETKAATFKQYSASLAPYAIRDVFNIGNGVLKSITIPVVATGAADDNGDFILTMYVVDNSYAGLRKKALETYELKVNGAAYEIQANSTSVYKFVKLDLTDYDIKLSEKESVAFFSAKDTLFPAYLAADATHSNQALNLLKKDFPQITGFFTKVGTSNLSNSDGTLFYDFEFERTYENRRAYNEILAEETAYQNKIAELKSIYQGKKLSVIGDSISTFNGVSNNTSYNKTIGNNAVWYPKNNVNFYNYTYTYWGRLLNDLGMELCVNNAWSGSRLYGNPSINYADNMLGRATELDNDNRTPNNPSDDINPDVILVYIGINDLHTGSPNDANLYKNLTAANADQASVMNNWIASVEQTAQNSGSTITPGTTYTSWEAAYALSIKAMREKYPNAEIYCMLLVRSQDSRDTGNTLFEHYNCCISAIAEYFGATVIDQANDGYLLQENCHAYGSDLKSLHPNQKGHELMERVVVETIYKKKKNG